MNSVLHRTSTPRRSPDIILLAAVAILCGIGIVMVFSASSATASSYATLTALTQQQILSLGIGLIAATTVASLPLTLFRGAALSTLIILSAALILCFVPHIGIHAGNAARWIHIGPLSLQPSELAKIAVVIYLATSFSYRHDAHLRIGATLTDILPVVAIIALTMREPDLGTAIVIATISATMLFAANVKLSHLFALALLGGTAVVTLVAHNRLWLGRLLAFRHPWSDPLGTGYHIIQSLYALGTGGLSGLGLGNSREKFYYLPEHTTDFIFSIIGEELGLLGTIVVLVLFSIIAYRAYRIAINAPDTYSRLLAIGAGSTILVQALLNIGVVTGSLPVTGVPLPFISFGGSALLADCLAVGMLANISMLPHVRHTHHVVVARLPLSQPLPIQDDADPVSHPVWTIEHILLDLAYALHRLTPDDTWDDVKRLATELALCAQRPNLPPSLVATLCPIVRTLQELFAAYFRALADTSGDERAARMSIYAQLTEIDLTPPRDAAEAFLRYTHPHHPHHVAA